MPRGQKKVVLTGVIFSPLQGGPPTSFNWVYNSYNLGYKNSEPFIRPFIGVITPFVSGRGPPCT